MLNTSKELNQMEQQKSVGSLAEEWRKEEVYKDGENDLEMPSAKFS